MCTQLFQKWELRCKMVPNRGLTDEQDKNDDSVNKNIDDIS